MSRSSSSSRPTAASYVAPGRSRAGSHTSRAATRASVTTRSSFPLARSGRWRSWGTTGRQSALTGLLQLALSCELSVTLAPPPVDLAAEDDHVRHYVKPQQQDRRAAERPQRHVD